MKALTVGIIIASISLIGCEKCTECRNQWDYDDVETQCGTSDEIKAFESDMDAKRKEGVWYRCTPVKK